MTTDTQPATLPAADEPALPHTCRCGARWAGNATAHCAADCHKTFTSPTSFRAHRKDGHCKTPRGAGLIRTQRAGYVAYGFPADEAAMERLRAARAAA